METRDTNEPFVPINQLPQPEDNWGYFFQRHEPSPEPGDDNLQGYWRFVRRPLFAQNVHAQPGEGV